MSEKKDNKDLFQNGAQRRQAREAREKKASKKTRLTALIIVLVLVIVFAGAMLINSNFLRRSVAAVTVGDVKFTAAEFDYFYYSSYREYEQAVYQQMPDYAESLLPNSNVSLKSQIYDPATGQTWADYFHNSALEKMQNLVKLYTAAEAAGFTLPEDAAQKMEDDLLGLSSTSILYGYESFEQYLSAMYGSAMTEKVFRKLMTKAYTADAYAAFKNDEFTYTDEEITRYYDENKDMFDMFKYRYFLVTSETPETAEDASDEEKEAAKAEALAAAGVKANEMKARMEKSADVEAAFIEEAKNYSPDSYGEPDSTFRDYRGDTLGSTYGEWLRDSARKEGDVFTVETTTGYYVVYFGERTHHEYPMPAMRQILISRSAVNVDDYAGGADDPVYIEAFNMADSLARTIADQVYAEFAGAGATEEKLLELMPEHSNDTTEGGFYENIYKGQMVPEIDEWLFDSVRKEGDSELVRTESFGYHLLYYMGTGRLYKDYLAETEKRADDYEAWVNSLTIPDAKTHWAIRLTK